MDGKLFYKYAKPCVENGIVIYPKGSNFGMYKIIICRKGEEKEGKEFYKNEPYIRDKEIDTPRGKQKVKEVVPSVWDKIFSLYKEICIKNNFIEIN